MIVRMETVTRRTIRYSFAVVRGETPIGEGALTSVFVRKPGGGVPIQAIEIPADVIARLRAASA